MRLYINGRDVSGLVEKIVWSGDDRQVARTLDFTLIYSATDRHIPGVAVDEGDPVRMTSDAGAELFFGIVFEIDRAASGNTLSFFAYDLLYYIHHNQLNMKFNDTAKKIAEKVCKEMGVTLKYAEDPKGKVKFNCFGNSGYEAILIGYTQAHRKYTPNDQYIPLMDGQALTVVKLGMDSGVALDPNTNLTEVSYRTSATKVINRVVVTNKNGKKLGEVEDAASRAKYGTLQEVYQADSKKAGLQEAMVKIAGLEQVASATALHDPRAVAGRAVTMIENSTGLTGRFYITGDTHTFTNGQAVMSLDLSFKNLMDKIDIPK